MKPGLYLLLLTCLLGAGVAQAQVQKTEQAPQTPPVERDHSYKPLTLKLNEDGSKYIRFIMWHQFWGRYINNNPGTNDLNGAANGDDWDFGLRRSRFLAYAQISPRFLILTHFGINNHTFVNGGDDGSGNFISSGNKKPGLFIHDAWTEYALIPGTLHIGAGLHYWNGISRMSSGSTLTFMTLDAPIFNWPTIELTDQFARQYGIYAKGYLGKLDYRIAVNKPFTHPNPANYNPAPNGRAVNRPTDTWATQGYFSYNILDKESNLLPYYVGTYIGAKRVLNIGAGFHYQPGATGSRTAAGTDQTHNIRLFGADVYYDAPIGEASAINVYSSYYNYDFGPGYLRNVGIMNIGFGGNSLNGPGNLQPTIGTGNILYTQLGYAFPKFNEGQQLMPYLSHTYKSFERLNDSSNQFALGLNYFINGHHAKLTLEYATRPVFTTDGTHSGQNPGQFTLQTHIFL
jgi:hypothetical protein